MVGVEKDEKMVVERTVSSGKEIRESGGTLKIRD
jgi:septum formation inhibitor MinC